MTLGSTPSSAPARARSVYVFAVELGPWFRNPENTEISSEGRATNLDNGADLVCCISLFYGACRGLPRGMVNPSGNQCDRTKHEPHYESPGGVDCR
jgi:hypothetical protein